jgi:hypothetical protein
MTKPAKAPRPTGRAVQLRKGTTLEMVHLSCPDTHQACLISESFGFPYSTATAFGISTNA